MSELASKLLQSVPGAADVLAAIGIDDQLHGAGRITGKLLECARAAQREWPDARFDRWLETTQQISVRLDELAAANPALAVSLYSESALTAAVGASLAAWRAPILQEGIEHRLTALIGRSIFVSAEQRTTVKVELIEGAKTLVRTVREKGKQSSVWKDLAGIEFHDLARIRQFRESIRPSSPSYGMVTALISALEIPIVGPTQDATVIEIQVLHAEDGCPDEMEPTAPTDASPRESGEGEQTALALQEFDQPSIESRLKAASFASTNFKLGLQDRDVLLPQDLAVTTRTVMSKLRQGSAQEQGFAALALVSLNTGCVDEAAANLKFHHSDSIWIDLERQAWAWDFRAYRGHDAAQYPAVEAIYCPLPTALISKLQQWRDAAPHAKSLKEFLLPQLGTKEIDFTRFRLFLRECGDAAHPAYRARFARSFGPALLSVTGSDMTAALMAGYFAAAAPAALYYFGPSTDLLHKRVSETFEFLGLGEATRPYPSDTRIACQKVLEPAAYQAGWTALMTAADSARAIALAASSLTETVEACNRWLQLLATAFVIQTGHRGTQLARLTTSALYTVSEMGIIHDKDDVQGDRAQPRLIPWTASVKCILRCVTECHDLIAQAAGVSAQDTSLAAEEPAFVKWVASNGSAAASVLPTGAVSDVTQEFFGSEHNFGRSMWVTALDAAGASRWLIRSFTGHTRDVTRVSGPQFDIPPIQVAKRLGDAMEPIAQALFGSQLPQTAKSEWLLPKVNLPQQLDCPTAPERQVPHPSTILEPLTSKTLAASRTAEQIRVHLVAGKMDASAPVLATLCLQFLDLLPTAELALQTVTDPKKNALAVQKSVGVLWTRPHFVHPAYIPISLVSWHLALQVQDEDRNRNKIIAAVCDAVRTHITCAAWPASNDACWNAIQACVQAFRRLQIAPSMVALSSTTVPAPALSNLSIRRLAQEDLPECDKVTPLVFSAKRVAGKRGADIQAVAKVLQKYADTSQRLGEKRQRAISCRETVEKIDVEWTAFGRFLREWLIEELHRTRDDVHGCYQLSSLATYFSTLNTAGQYVDELGTPTEWEESEWDQFIKWTAQCCATGRRAMTVVEAEERNDARAFPAVAALLRSVRRRGLYVSPSVFASLHLENEQIKPGDSASSVLILDWDFGRARRHAEDALRNYPADAIRLAIREALSSAVPVRAGDIGSMAWNCITGRDTLVIEPQGYNVHKSEATIRVVPLSDVDAHFIRKLRTSLEQFTGPTKFLLRGDGTFADGQRDMRITDLWNDALKYATDDPQARAHSCRASVLQDVVWHNWKFRASELLKGLSPPSESRKWADEQHQEWMRMSKGAAAAGHADLRSSMGNYLAGWSVVYGLTTSALLHDLVPAPAFMRQCNVDPAGARKARSRSVGSAYPFEEWEWLHSRFLGDLEAAREVAVKDENTSPLPSQPEKVASGERDAQATHEAAPLLQQIRYLTVRCMGLNAKRALERTGMLLNHAKLGLR